MAGSLWLLTTVDVCTTGEDAIFHDAEKEVRISGVGETAARLCDWLDGDHGEELLQFEAGRQLVALLDAQGWIVRLAAPLSEVTAGKPERTRQLAYFAQLSRHQPDRAFAELEAARVLIIGTGGIGSHAAYHLAASGVRRLLLNDFDRVEASNLNRQILFARGDLGQTKVDALAGALSERFEDLDLECLPDCLDETALERVFERVDLVLLCGEHPLPLDRPQLLGDRAIITAGYFGHETFVGPVVSPAHGTPSWAALLCDAEGRRAQARLEADARKLAHHWNCSGSTNNGLGGALLGEAAVRLLAPSLGGPLLRATRRFVDMRTLTTRDELWDSPQV